MSDDLLAIICCCILGLIAHGASRAPWLEWVLRVTYCLFLFGEFVSIASDPQASSESPFNHGVMIAVVAASTILLFKPGRQLFSLLFTFVNQVIAGRFLLAAFGKLQVLAPQSAVVEVPRRFELAEAVQDTTPTPVVDSLLGGAKQSEELQSAEGAPAHASVETPVGTPEAESQESSVGSAAVDSPESSSSEESASAGSSAESLEEPKAIDSSLANAEKGERESKTVSPNSAAPVRVSFLNSFFAERIFVADSIPHMNALWIYVTCLAFLLTHMEIAGFQMPSIMVPIAVTMDQLFSYNFLGLIMLAFCGCGIIVSRSPMETLKRLGLVKPSLAQVLIGIAGIFVTFAYDYLWSTYTHAQEGLGYADKLTHYNEGTFTGGASPGPAFLVASATGLCAGLGEETLIRGALQPVLGIIPAAFMHGVLHGQFSHAPLLIVQVFGWSTLMGIIRRYTNTTTTIITHVGFNFMSTFLIAFNP